MFLDEQGNPTPVAVSGKSLTLQLGYQVAAGKQVNYLNASVEFLGLMGELLFVCEVRLGRGGRFTEVPPKGKLVCHIPNFPLSSGSYGFNLTAKTTNIIDHIKNAGTITVEDGDFYGTGQVPGTKHRSVVMVQHRWDILADTPPR